MKKKESIIKRVIERCKYIHREGYWRKGYRETLVAIGVLGTALIAFSDYIFWHLVRWDVANVTLSDKIQAATLFLTGVVIFWYTRETYDLKRNQDKQLKETRRQTELQQRPFLRLEWNTYTRPTKITNVSTRGTTEKVVHDYYYQMILVNVGSGVAVNVEINLSLKSEAVANSRFFRTVTAMSPGGDTRIFDAYAEEKLENVLDPTRDGNAYTITVKYSNLEKHQYTQTFKTSPRHNDGFEVIVW